MEGGKKRGGKKKGPESGRKWKEQGRIGRGMKNEWRRNGRERKKKRKKRMLKEKQKENREM